MTQKTDELLEVRSSGYIAAEKCRDRALAYFNNNKYLLAIKQLHNAKIKWFSAETIRGSLLSMLTLSECYKRLGLIYPAKYYAACVAFLSIHHDDEEIKYLIPRALFMLATSCYSGGEWLNFAHIIRTALAAHYMFDERPLDIVNDVELQCIFAQAIIVRTLTRRFDETLEKAFNKISFNWPIDNLWREAIESLSEEHSRYWETISVKDFWHSVQTQLSGRPFSDVGKYRVISWKALGISWEVVFDNEYLTTCISEEFVSTLQIILADLANRDLVLLPTNVIIYSSIIDELEIDFRELPDNEASTWRVGFPRTWIKNDHFLEKLQNGILGLVFTILGKCTVLKYENFMGEMKRTFAEGLPNKTFIIRPYSELYTEFLPEDNFYSPYRGSLTTLWPGMEFETPENEQLRWVDGDGPGYSRERAVEFLTNRYAGTIKPIRLTLPRLLADEEFRGLICQLKDESYLDWEILLLVANICVDHRLKKILPPAAPPDEQIRIMKSLFREEREDDIEVPASVFTQERISLQKKIQIGTITKTWGLELHKRTPDFIAIERLLDTRYHNSEDDIEHEDFFGGI